MAKNYDEDEDFYDQQADKDDFRRSGKMRNKGSGTSGGHKKHRRGDLQEFMDEIDRQQEEFAEQDSLSHPSYHAATSPAPYTYHAPYVPAPSGIPQHHEHRFGPNTVEFKGVKIDLDGVKEALPIESRHNGLQTYGIKFVFSGEKGFYKIVWYETDKIGRDVDCAKATKARGSAR